MTIITNIEVMEVPHSHEHIMQTLPSRLLNVKKNELPEHEYAYVIQNEIINGRVFVDRNKKRITIGCTKEVQKLMGIQYEVYDDLMKRNKQAEDQVTLYKIAPFLIRLKWLFTGVK